MKYTETASISSSGNVFADLGLENSDELQAKADLARSISEIIKHRKLPKQKPLRCLAPTKPKLVV